MSDKQWALVGLTDADAARWRAADAEEGPLVGRLVAVEGVERGPVGQVPPDLYVGGSPYGLKRMGSSGEQVVVHLECGRMVDEPTAHALAYRYNNWEAKCDQLEAARAEVVALRVELAARKGGDHE